MIRTASGLALLAVALLASAPGTARGQERLVEGRLAAEAPETPATPASLSYPRSTLSYVPAGERRDGGRGIDDATTGVWVGALVGVVAGGLLSSWAFCGLGEGECGFSITAAGPGMLIGGILGASVGGLLDSGPPESDHRRDGP